jgi:hypothetical protein
MLMKMFETDNSKVFRSKDINFNFNKVNGFTMTWGNTLKDDPDVCPYGNMILDIEITDICKGVGNEGPCPWCYKSNTAHNKSNMSFEMFKTIMDKMPKYNGVPLLQQIALGLDAQCESNPDVWKMMEYSRTIGVIPNVTVADISDEVADKLVNVVGAASVSRYPNKNYCYDSIKKLTDRGLKQTNMHILSSIETIGQIYETFSDYLNGDPRLKGLNAIVLLSLKQKGRGKGFHPLPQGGFKNMVDCALDNNIPLGFDSCSAHRFLDSVRDRDNFKQLEMLSEPCESGLSSYYINSKGFGFPCSFTEEGEGIDVTNCNDFIKDVWNHEKTVSFRDKLLKNNRHCPVFDV